MAVDNETQVLSLDDALGFVGDPELLVEIIGMLLEEVPEQMAFIDSHWNSRDLVNLYKTAHRLKGNFGVVAAHQAREAAATLERVAKAEDSVAAEEAVGELRSAVATVVPLLEQHVAPSG